MPISGDGAVAFPRLPAGKLLQVSSRSRLIAIAAGIELRHGPPRSTLAQPESILASAALKIAQSGGDLTRLTHRERKASVELCWVARDGWKPDRTFVREWLRWADFNWNYRVGISRIAVSYVRNYDEDAVATAMVGKWLALQRGKIGGKFGDVFRHYGLEAGISSVSWIAKSMADGSREFFARIERDTKSSAVFQGSGILVTVMARYGAYCGDGRVQDVAGITKSLVDHVGGTGIGGKASQRSRDAARVSMIEGITKWAVQTGSQEAVAVAVAACLSLAGDPRHSKAQWQDISPGTVEVIHGWLTARTIENMFQVIATLQTDQPDQVASRLRFWRTYLPYIRRAYLVCAKKAKPIAESLNERYGALEGADPLHCGLLMEIVGPQGDRIVALEINKNASALFWKSNSKTQPPDFYSQLPYNRPSYLTSHDKRLTHTLGWQANFAQFIESETGLRYAKE